MSKFTAAFFTSALLALGASPAAHAAVPLPPTDPVHWDGGGCSPPSGDPCDPTPGTFTVDKTYPSRVVAWAEGLLP